MSEENAAPAPTPPPAPPPGPWQRALGVLLIIIGVLLVAGAGLCTMVFSARGSEMVGMALMAGGPFILVGALLWWGGVALRRPK